MAARERSRPRPSASSRAAPGSGERGTRCGRLRPCPGVSDRTAGCDVQPPRAACARSPALPPPATEGASALDGCSGREGAPAPGATPGPSGSCWLNRQTGRSARRPRRRGPVTTESGPDTSTRAARRAPEGCCHPRRRASSGRGALTASAIVATVAAAARSLSSRASAQMRTSGPAGSRVALTMLCSSPDDSRTIAKA